MTVLKLIVGVARCQLLANCYNTDKRNTHRTILKIMKKTNPERYQVVLLLQDGTETDVWTDYKNVAISVAKDMRSRHPDAPVVVLNDYEPVPTYF